MSPPHNLSPAGLSPASLSPANKERFVVRLAAALHRSGCTAPRLEDKLNAVGARLGVPCEVLVTPTSLQIAFGEAPDQRLSLLRVQPSAADLGRLARLYRIADAVASGEQGVGSGQRDVEAVALAPAPYRSGEFIAAHAIVAGFVTVFFGAGPAEIGAAFVVGALVGAVCESARTPSRRLVIEPVAAIAATCLAAALGRLDPSLSVYVVLVSGLIVLLPGLALTLGAAEIAARHLVSGTARLAAGCVTLVLLAVGVAIGIQALGPVDPGWARIPGEPSPAWLFVAAHVGLAVGNVVLFSAGTRDLGSMLAGGVVAWLGALAGEHVIGAALAPVVGAFAVSSAAHVFARRTGRPSGLVSLPGLIVLVPGALGFKGLALLLSADVIAGIGTVFEVALVAGGLVTGTLLAHVLVPPGERCGDDAKILGPERIPALHNP